MLREYVLFFKRQDVDFAVDTSSRRVFYTKRQDVASTIKRQDVASTLELADA
jgi:hypothetical protein